MAHDYSCVMVRLPDGITSLMRDHAAKIGDWALADDGRENDFHATVLFGLHSDSPKEVRAALAGEKPILLSLGKLSLFENDDADVLKSDVESEDLHRLNKKLRTLPHTNTYPTYKPHATIAYVKPGLGKRFIESSLLEGKTAIVDHVIFSSKNGTKTKIKLGALPPSTGMHRYRAGSK